MKRIGLVLSVFASACFGEIDGGGDPPGDDNPPPPPPTDVQIIVHDSAGPIAGLPIVFLDANDGLAADVLTDAQGMAIAKLAAGSVTVMRHPDAMQPESPATLYTYVGVKAGDKLDLVMPAIRPSMPVTVAIKVPLTENTTPVTITTPCGSGTGVPPTVELTLDGCGTQTDFYVTDAGLDGTPASFLKRATIAPMIDLSTEVYMEALTSTYSVTNAPADASVTIEKRIETDLFRPVFTTGPIPVTLDTPIEVTLPNLPGTEEQTYATLSYPNAAQIIGSRDPYGSGPAVIDLAAAMIVTPSSPTLAGDTVTWTEQGSGAPDIVLTQLGSANVVRYVASPYAGATVKIPHLPAAYDTYNVKTADVPTVALAKVGGGFDGVRARVFAGPLAPIGGTATVSLTNGSPTDPKL